jgi:hypothetical protein
MFDVYPSTGLREALAQNSGSGPGSSLSKDVSSMIGAVSVNFSFWGSLSVVPHLQFSFSCLVWACNRGYLGTFGTSRAMSWFQCGRQQAMVRISDILVHRVHRQKSWKHTRGMGKYRPFAQFYPAGIPPSLIHALTVLPQIGAIPSMQLYKSDT